jgi:biotin carboxyl carrier protein
VTNSDAPGTTEIRAEWAGRVAALHVAPGDAVAEGADLVTLEAMKMLSVIASPRGGTVAEVLVTVDDFVDQGTLLLRLQ